MKLKVISNQHNIWSSRRKIFQIIHFHLTLNLFADCLTFIDALECFFLNILSFHCKRYLQELTHSQCDLCFPTVSINSIYSHHQFYSPYTECLPSYHFGTPVPVQSQKLSNVEFAQIQMRGALRKPGARTLDVLLVKWITPRNEDSESRVRNPVRFVTFTYRQINLEKDMNPHLLPKQCVEQQDLYLKIISISKKLLKH